MHRKRDPRKDWARRLPRSRMVFPETIGDQAKYMFWLAIRPYHTFFRDSLTSLHIIDRRKYTGSRGRQKYLLGTLAPGRSIEEFVQHLVAHGFGNHFVAWKDDGEVVGLRLVQGFKYQYHIRIFEDGEVRAHFEYTPEYKPIKHLKSIGQEARFDRIAPFLEGWLVPVRQNTPIAA